MKPDVPKNSKDRNFKNSGLPKLIVLVAFLAWLLSRCGSDGNTQNELEPSPSPTSTWNLDTEDYEAKLEKYFDYFSFCREVDDLYSFEQDLKLLDKGLLAPGDFSNYLLAIGRHGIEVQGEAEAIIDEYGFHEDEELANQFGQFGEQVLRLRMQIDQLDTEQLTVILQNYESLTSKTKTICDDMNPSSLF